MSPARDEHHLSVFSPSLIIMTCAASLSPACPANGHGPSFVHVGSRSCQTLRTLSCATTGQQTNECPTPPPHPQQTSPLKLADNRLQCSLCGGWRTWFSRHSERGEVLLEQQSLKGRNEGTAMRSRALRGTVGSDRTVIRGS